MDRTPYTIIADTNETLMYEFTRPIRVGRKLYQIDNTRRKLCLGNDTRLSGDYSIAGHERPTLETGLPSVILERKSLADLFGTLGAGRERFARKLELIDARYTFAAVVVEATWEQILNDPPPHSKLNPVTIFHSVLAWQIRYPVIHWQFCGSRELGEAFTIRILDRFYREHNGAWPKPAPKKRKDSS